MDGFLVINKPKGWTSADVVNKIKRILKVKKAGHLGTLDPDATGVLPVALGKATKVIPYINEGDKGYMVVMKLGESTDTLDASGKVIEKREIPPLDEEKIKRVFKEFTGKISQIPPAYSAVKVSGVRAYELARRGEAVKLKPREIIIKDINLIKKEMPYITFDVLCSKGTYIRTLCQDIGERLGTAAHMFSLVRTHSGRFRMDDSVNIDDLEKGDLSRIISIDKALEFMPRITIIPEAVEKIKNGMPAAAGWIKDASARFSSNEKVRIYSDDMLLAIGTARYDSSHTGSLMAKEKVIKIDRVLI